MLANWVRQRVTICGCNMISWANHWVLRRHLGQLGLSKLGVGVLTGASSGPSMVRHHPIVARKEERCSASCAVNLPVWRWSEHDERECPCGTFQSQLGAHQLMVALSPDCVVCHPGKDLKTWKALVRPRRQRSGNSVKPFLGEWVILCFALGYTWDGRTCIRWMMCTGWERKGHLFEDLC